MPPIQVFLGPLLGFLFTAGTLLFVALNAYRTVPDAAPVAAAEPMAPTAPVEPAPVAEAPVAPPETPGEQA
jgi:hypothetical protein